MKKTITVNLSGRVFTMDEDAYRLLDNYLSNLRIYFRKEEGSSEIIADFEARIEELFSEKTRLGYEVITIEHVEEVIARVGKPDDFAEKEEAKEEAKEEKQAHFTEVKDVKKKFYRNVEDKMFGGVCSGIAAYFGWDVIVVRIISIVLLFATSLWIGLFYLIAWIVFPVARTAEQKLQMRGKPITVENIGKTVAAEAEPAVRSERNGCLTGFVDLCVGLMKVFLIGLGFLIGLPLLFAFIIVIIVLVAVLFGAGAVSGEIFGFIPSFIAVNNPVLATTAFLLVVGIPIVALIYALIAHFAKLNPINSAVRWIFLLIWILALVLFLSSGFRIDKNWFRDWNWSYVSDYNIIKGNGIPSEKTYILEEPVNYVEAGKYLCAVLQIEQTQDETPSLVISGDENLVDQVRYDLQNGRLNLSANDHLNCENNLRILLRTNDLKGIHSGFIGNIKMNRAFTSEDMEIKITGPGSFIADSLYINSLKVRSEGVAYVDLSGKVNVAHLDLSGTGKIDATELLSDTVYAQVSGVGTIQCNPSEYLDGVLKGIGTIIYKEEPKNKNISTAGIGRIKRK